jgi:hypothetical protein
MPLVGLVGQHRVHLSETLRDATLNWPQIEYEDDWHDDDELVDEIILGWATALNSASPKPIEPSRGP